MANRVWGNYFGSHLVETPSDFGTRSLPPKHPLLLDWLASELIEQGWSLKNLHRQIALSATYRQSSALTAPQKADGSFASANFDPENSLFWRMNRKRLDFEALRDSALAVSGQLDLKMGGPSVKIDSQVSHRRTVYSFIDRQNLPGMFRTFDFASPDTHSPKRYETTVPQQGLFLLNSPFLLEQSKQLAARSQQDQSEQSIEERITKLYQLCLSRDPSPDELALGKAFLDAGKTPTKITEVIVPWTYGYGVFDEKTGSALDFNPLPHWTGSAWQGGGNLPDDKLGWASLNAAGGHPAKQFAVVRRYTVPADGTLTLRGRLKHSSREGDGVRGTLFSNRQGRLDLWVARNKELETDLKPVSVKAGETWDFIVDCRGDEGFDSFVWPVTLELQSDSPRIVAKSLEQFRGKGSGALTQWDQYAQVLLLSNEFAFID